MSSNTQRLQALSCHAVLWLVAIAIPIWEGNAASSQPAPGPGQGYVDTPILPGQIWRVHDRNRPRPGKVTPGQQGGPPSDASVLFDGKDLSQWKRSGSNDPATWNVTDGYFQAGKGTIESKDHFGDIQLHLEWAAPEELKGEGQGRGNSGVIFMGKYEVQILDSFSSDTYADGQAAAIYGQFPPQVNATLEPGKWQTYDIIFEAPRFDGEKLTRPAKATVFHNGVLVHHAREFIGPMAHKEIHPYKAHAPTGPLVLQDHGNPVRFRNVWVRKVREDIDPWLSFPGSGSGPGKGKHLVLISGDEEYRSEQSLPLLAQILSKRHGFDCTVLFAINPDTGTVDPNYVKNIPGLHHLEKADGMILFTRMRTLPDWQMKYFEDYVNRGGPIVAIRTATHPFVFPRNSESRYAKWSFDNRDKEWEGGFGRQVLGDTWISHHGKHKSEATRAVTVEASKSDPILKGVSDIFVPTDVYGIIHLPDTAKVLLLGEIVAGMNPTDKAADDKRNQPMMPVAWTKSYQSEGGQPCRIFCTTMGSSVDFQNEGMRRLVVNAALWSVGLEDQIPEKSDVSYEGTYKPSFYGFFNKPVTYFKDQLLKPSDFLVK